MQYIVLSVNVYYANLQIALVVDLRCCHSISDCSVDGIISGK
jgi:hypothetical protein